MLRESARELGNIGTRIQDIQVSPNATRLLLRWDLCPALRAHAVEPTAIVFRRYGMGVRAGYTRWGSRVTLDHGAPYYHIHRGDYQAMLHQLACAAGVRICLGAPVRAVQPDPAVQGGPSVTLASGEVFYADLVVGADGVKSTLQKTVTGLDDRPREIGDAAYRATVSIDHLLQDPELRPFVETAEMTAWMAPGRHMMGYCIRAKKEYNMVLIHPDDGSVESWTSEGSGDKMRADFADFEPRVQKILSFVKSTLKWRLMDRKPLPTWVHPKGRVVLLGDACHPMLPYIGQGAAITVEDAAVLGAVLSHVSSLAQVPALLQAYQDLRLPRASATQDVSRFNREVFHMPDGPAQRARDEAMRAATAAELDEEGVTPPIQTDGNPNQCADRTKIGIQFGYDAYAEVERWWNAGGRERIEALAGTGSDGGRAGMLLSRVASARVILYCMPLFVLYAFIRQT